MSTRRPRPLVLGDYRGEVAPQVDDPVFLEALRDPGALWARPEVRILAGDRNRLGVVRLPLSSGREAEVVVKEFFSSGLPRLKTLFLPSKAAKAWRGAWALTARGFETAEPLAFLEKKRWGSVARSFFLAAKIQGAEEVRGLFRNLPDAELERFLSELGRCLASVHERGILHRDLSDGNVLVRRTEEGGFTFYFLDTNRIRIRRSIGWPRRAKNLIRLGVPDRFQRYFLEEYSGERPLPHGFYSWYMINKKTFTAYIGLKKKLRLRRLARRLRIQ